MKFYRVRESQIGSRVELKGSLCVDLRKLGRVSVKLKRACDQADNDAAGRSSATEVRSPGGGVPGGGACVRGAAARII